jgi:predicted MFS family arabinose efflux permease
VGVLRLRDFRLLLGAQSVSHLGDRMVVIALAFAVLELGGSASEIGLVLACRMLPMVATLLIGGVVADRMSRRALMVIADLVRLVLQSALAWLVISGAAEIWMLAALAGATGAASGFSHPAATGVLPSIVPAEDLQRATGVRAIAMSGAEIIGPALAGVLVAAVGPGWALAVDAASYAFSAGCLLALRLAARVPRAASSFIADLRQGWGTFRSMTWVWTFVAGAAMGNVYWGAWSALGPVVAEQSLGGAAAWGSIMAALGVGAVLGSLTVVRARPRRPMLRVVLVDGLFVLPLAFLAAGAPVGLIAFGALLAGGAMMFGNSIWEATLMRHVPHESLSRVSAYDWFGSLAFQPLGLAIWGPISELIGISTALWVSASLVCVTTLWLLSVPAIRNLREAVPSGA